MPKSIRSDVTPTLLEQKLLRQHIKRLEDILNEVDAVTLPTGSGDDVSVSRKARRELVTDIVGVIDGIERHIQPNTPESESKAEENVKEDDDNEDSALIDMEIQRVIMETLARKKDDEVAVNRKSVTVEDIPDEEY